eukprot:m.292612 g.292612  ORF g.292612 m.292612 type:complete len:327 (-) comp20005_c0_seq1:644-1624(-)
MAATSISIPATDQTEHGISCEESPWERSIEWHGNNYNENVSACAERLKDLVPRGIKLLKEEKGKKFTKAFQPIYLVQSEKHEGNVQRGVSEQSSYQIAKICLETGNEKKFMEPFEVDGENDRQASRQEKINAWQHQCYNHAKCLQDVLDWGEKKQDVTVDKLVALQKKLLEGAISYDGSNNTATTFATGLRKKEENVHAGTFMFPCPNDMSLSLEKTLNTAMLLFQELHPIEWACLLLSEVVSLHPFRNGNGRIARLLFVYGLARHGISAPVIFGNSHKKSRQHYIRALKAFQGQRGQSSNKELHSMGIAALHSLLNNLITYCAKD